MTKVTFDALFSYLNHIVSAAKLQNIQSRIYVASTYFYNVQCQTSKEAVTWKLLGTINAFNEKALIFKPAQQFDYGSIVFHENSSCYVDHDTFIVSRNVPCDSLLNRGPFFTGTDACAEISIHFQIIDAALRLGNGPGFHEHEKKIKHISAFGL